MSSLHLSHLNSSFKVDDKHGHTRLIITKLDFSMHPDTIIPEGLRLEVVDENELVLLSELIAPFLMKELAGKVAYIHQEFAIFNHLTIRLITDEADIAFETEVYFVLSN